MATYVLLSSLTPEGGQTLHSHPERLNEVNKEIDNFGCTVISQYALLATTTSSPSSRRPTTRPSRTSRSISRHAAPCTSRRTRRSPIESLVQKLGDSKQLGHT